MVHGFVISVNDTAPTAIHTASGRTRVRARNGNPTDIYFGDAGVAALNGWLTFYTAGVPETSLVDVVLEDGDTLYGIAASGNWAVNVLTES